MTSYSYGGWKSSARQNKTMGAILVGMISEFRLGEFRRVQIGAHLGSLY